MSGAIHPGTAVGPIRLTVADRDRAQGFYERTIGLRTLEGSAEVARLGTEAAGTLVELHGVPGAPPRPARATGLFHLAILVPSRLELARAVRRVVDAGWSFTGASDHLVSEALYLDDPEGNGIEIYRDRPREEWREVDGELQMATLPLDLEDVMRELPAEPVDRGGLPEDTRIGHVHLQVADLEAADSFYRGVLGFEVTVRSYPGALFLSAGGYHHHLGLNTWASAAGRPPPPGSRGLERFAVVSPDAGRLAARVEGAGLPAERRADGWLVADPSGNRVLLTTPAAG